MKSILFFIIELPHGGAEWVIANLCNQLAQKGVKVTLVTVKGGDLVKEIDNKVKVNIFNGNYYKAFWYIYKRLILRKDDAVFSTLRTQSLILSFLHFLSLSNAVLNIREAASNFSISLKKYPRLLKLLYSFSYRRADNIICNSEGTAKNLLKIGILKDGKKIQVINNPLDIKEIQNKANTATPDCINYDRFTIVSVGRLVPQKRVDLIIHSLKRVKREITDAQLIIIGDGKSRSSLEELSKKLGLSDSVFFLGHLQNPYPYMKKADLFALASEWEGFGMVIVESLALGTPVVATDVEGGPKQILNNGEFGELVAVGSDEDFANKLIECSKKHVASKALIDRASIYDKKVITEQYYDLIF